MWIAQKLIIMRTSLTKGKPSIAEMEESDPFENVTEEEIISLWQSFKCSHLSDDEAWNAIVTSIALDMAFSRSKNLPRMEQ
jgi:hypothetical protein